MEPGFRAWFDARRRVQLVALLLAVAAAAFLIFARTGSGASTTVSSDGTTTTTVGTATTLVETNGRGVLVVLLAPVVLTGVALLWTGRGRAVAAVTCTVLLALLCIAGLLTIGVFYLPAAIAAGVAFALPARRAPRPIAPARAT